MSRPVGLDVQLRERWPRCRLGRFGETADQCQALCSMTQTVAPEQPPNPITGNLDAAPLRPTQLQADAIGAPAWEPRAPGAADAQSAATLD